MKEAVTSMEEKEGGASQGTAPEGVAIDMQKVFAALQGTDAAGVRAAVEMLEGLVAERADNAPAWLGLGVAAARGGRWPEAQAHFERALAADPKFAQAHVNLGNLHRVLGRRAEARAAYEKAIALQPGLAEAHLNLGMTLDEEGLTQEAEAAVRRALLFRPAYAEAHNNLGHILLKCGKVEQALSYFRQALAWQEDLLPARSNLVVALYRLGRNAEAEAEIARLLAERPDDPQVLRVQAAGLAQQGRLEEAAAINRKLMALEPEAVDLRMNQGEVLLAGKDYAGAAACYRALLDAGRVPPALGVGALANVALAAGDYAQAKGLYQQALMLDARLPLLNLGLARSLLEAGESRLGLEMLRKAVDLFPLAADVHSLLIDALRLDVGAGETVRALEIARWKERHDRGGRRQGQAQPRKAGEVLRLGFVVGDLERGAAATALACLLPALDATRFDVFVYHAGRAGERAALLQERTAHWRPAVGLGTADLAEQMRQDGIDVLIDMIGHGPGSRLQALTEKPALLQLSWLGDHADTGVAQLDGVLDESALPALLPWQAPEAELPLSAESAGRVFGVVSPLAHIDEDCLDAWAEILLAAPESRLLWLTDTAEEDTATRERFRRLMALREIEPERVDLRPRLEEAARRRAIGEMALVLDGFAVSLGPAALECLWCGTPVLSVRGDASWRRTAAALLAAAGLGEWVAAGRDDYVARAAATTGNTAASRERLRQCLQASPIMDATGFADAFGRTIEALWDELSVEP